jgi:hypothetical protein
MKIHVGKISKKLTLFFSKYFLTSNIFTVLKTTFFHFEVKPFTAFLRQKEPAWIVLF